MPKKHAQFRVDPRLATLLGENYRSTEQALNRKPMCMADWIAKLDDFIRIMRSGSATSRSAGRRPTR